MIAAGLALFTGGACFLLGMATALIATGLGLWHLHGRQK